MGKVSYSEKRNKAGAPLSRSWYSYDERGRVVWMVQDITGLGVKTVDYAYGPAGNVQLVSYQADNEAKTSITSMKGSRYVVSSTRRPASVRNSPNSSTNCCNSSMVMCWWVSHLAVPTSMRMPS